MMENMTVGRNKNLLHHDLAMTERSSQRANTIGINIRAAGVHATKRANPIQQAQSLLGMDYSEEFTKRSPLRQ